ncbi:DM13 domain-containing protein [Candidatus Gracilibacteria bacterium]|nr:DM13 domain-containing protein [Candidatus Gracilibacteria bacterium]
MKKIFAILVIIGVIYAGNYFISPLFIDEVVEEDFPEVTTMTEQDMEKMTEVEVAKLMEDSAASDEEMEEPMAKEMEAESAIKVKSGTLQDADSSHKGSGDVHIYQLPDKSHLLRLENLNVTNGPALHVLLSTEANPQGSLTGDYLDLGDLKGNIGNQNYEIPSGTDLSLYKSLVIYCKPFKVIFSTSALN